MKRLKDATEVVAFGKHLTPEQIKRSGVLRRLADGSSVDPSVTAALLPQEQFMAWCHFHHAQMSSTEQLKLVLQVRKGPKLLGTRADRPHTQLLKRIDKF